MIVLTPPQINVIIEDLTGTCHSRGDTIEELTGYALDEIDPESLLEIDHWIFQCEECGWWCELSEMSDVDEICQACGPVAVEDE